MEPAILTYPQIDPVAFTLPLLNLPVHWYGISYIAGLLLCRYLFAAQLKRTPHAPKLDAEQQSNLILFYGTLGVIIGGRLGSIFFYHHGLLLQPVEMLSIHKGGMSFHGGLIGVVVAMLIYSKLHKCPFSGICDSIAVLTPIGLGLGRIANFVNGELWGRPTDLPWGMVFPHVDAIPRHPSQLYEALLEGLLLYVLLRWYSHKPRAPWGATGMFISLYAIFRFMVEFTREPDAHIGFIIGKLSMGQLLSLIMLAIGLATLYLSHRNNDNATVS